MANKRSQTPKFRLMPKLRQLTKKSPQLAKEFFHSWNLVKALIAIEIVINYLVIKHVKYTEIDWSTYMTQVSQVFNRTKPNFNYTEIEGPTGPLVYPAGHLYVYYLFKELTDGGTNIQFAQYIFMIIYIAQLILVYKTYSHKRVHRVSFLLISNDMQDVYKSHLVVVAKSLLYLTHMPIQITRILMSICISAHFRSHLTCL